MEIANVKYITIDNRSLFKDECSVVPSYAELKKLKPVIVNDLLELEPEKANVDLLNCYIDSRFLLVPVCRKTKARQVNRSPDFPSRILLEITSRCNLRCVMCPRNLLKRSEADMPKDVVLRCIDEMDRHGIDGLWLFNIGESLLHPDFEEIFDACQRKKNLGSLWMSTNGQEISAERMDLLINSKLTFLNYSLNAMSEESYKKVSLKGNFERLTSNLESLLKKKAEYNRMGSAPWVRIQMIEQPQVLDEIDLFLSTYSKKAEFLSINLLEGWGQNISVNVDYIKKRDRRQKRYCNRLLRSDCIIFSDGNVTFCAADFNHEMSLGNIYNSSIEEIWNGGAHRYYKQMNQNGRLDELPLCSGCLDYDL